MANGTAAPAARGTQRESFSAPVVPVDEKRFESEIRRVDALVLEEKKSREKFETRIEKSISDLRGEMDVKFNKVDARFDKVDAKFDKVDEKFDKVDAKFEKIEGEIKDLRDEMSGRMNRLEDRLWWIFGAVILSILVPVLLKYL
jgi:chromosome segregation ATPase